MNAKPTAASAPQGDFSLADPAFYGGDPHPVFAELRREAPVYWNADVGFWAISCFDDARAVLGRPETFSSAGGTVLYDWVSGRGQFLNFGGSIPPDAAGLVEVDPPLHTKYKRMVLNTDLFGPRAMPSVEPIVRDVVRDALRAIPRGSSVDVERAIAAPIAGRVMGRFLGLADADTPRLLHWTQVIEHATSGVASEDELAEAGQLTQEMWADVLDRMADGGGSGCLAGLRRAQLEADIVDLDSLAATACDILIAGTDGLLTALTGAIVTFAEHPDQWALVADGSSVPQAVEELLRWITPIAHVARRATEDVELRGVPIKTGDRVLVLLASANRDEATWTNAAHLDVARPIRPRSLSFGAGVHLCVGATLARLALAVLFEELRDAEVQMELAGVPQRVPGFGATAKYGSAEVVRTR